MNLRLAFRPHVAFLAATMVAATITAAAQASPVVLTQAQKAADFDHLWQFTRDHYCCFGEKATDWNAVRDLYRPRAIAAPDPRAFIAVLEQVLDELYDAHSHLTVNLSTSWRLPAYDLWAEWRDGCGIIVDVRAGSAAARAGLRPGMEIVRVNGSLLLDSVAARLPRSLRHPDPAAHQWALQSVLAGRRDVPRRFTIRADDGQERIVILDDTTSAPGEALVSHRILPGNIGYIRISSFHDQAAVAAFDSALHALRGTRALVIDVRNNHGGDTAVSRPIMGRLIGRRQQYAWMARRQESGLGRRWPEFVDPRGPWTYRAPVAVLVNHFTDSTAEGFAMGLDGMRRAIVVGTPMGDLGAATLRTVLPHLGIGAQVSAEPVYHVDGRPRDAFVPAVQIDLADCGPPDGDCILAAALRTLDSRKQ